MISPKVLKQLKEITDAKHQAATSELKAHNAKAAAIKSKQAMLVATNAASQTPSAGDSTTFLAISLWQSGLNMRNKALNEQAENLSENRDQLIRRAQKTLGETEAVKALHQKTNSALRKPET